ncbi:hypothetical protein M5689_005973 [Euphorbia peplus]|nr:hypothetical protein M5689_005973 [Euphorbia peplus]
MGLLLDHHQISLPAKHPLSLGLGCSNRQFISCLNFDSTDRVLNSLYPDCYRRFSNGEDSPSTNGLYSLHLRSILQLIQIVLKSQISFYVFYIL